MKSISLSIRRAFNWFSLYREALLGCAIATIGLITIDQVYLYYLYSYANLVDLVKLADALVLTAGGYWHWIAFALVPVSAFGMLLTTRHDQEANWTIRKKGYIGVWKNSLLKAFGLALLLAVIITVSNLLLGMLWTNGLINFESKHSIFALATDGETMANPPFYCITVAFFACCFLVLFLANSLWVLASLLFSQKWIPMFCLIVLAFINQFDIPFVFDQGVQTLALVNISYPFWLFGQYYTFIIGAAAVIVIQVFNLFLTKRCDHL